MSDLLEGVPAEVDRLLAWLPGDFWRVADNVGRCIEASRICVAAWRRAGVDCRAVACDVSAYNPAAWDLRRAGVPVAKWPAVGAWSVGCSCDDRSEHVSLTDGSVSRFNGHVIVLGDGWFADLTAQQFHRPDKGINVTGVISGPWKPGSEGVIVEAVDTFVVYRSRPEVASWRLTNAWRQDLERSTLEQLAAVARGEVQV